ncbi:MAG: hypothetical protein ACRDL6_00390 [Solirubrobacterales bacterium]
MKPIVAILAVGLVALLWAAPSQGATASSAGGFLTITGGPGESNEIEVSYSPTVPQYQVVDVFSRITAGTGCVPTLSGAAVCSPVGVARIVVDAGDGADIVDLLLENAPGAIPATVRGGRGSDLLFGSTGADALVGGAGSDVMTGRGGNDELFGGKGSDVFSGGVGLDRLFAADGRRDRKLSCGPGSNRRERAKLDRRDPKPKSC